jgi:hypothetical protein
MLTYHDRCVVRLYIYMYIYIYTYIYVAYKSMLTYHDAPLDSLHIRTRPP